MEPNEPTGGSELDPGATVVCRCEEILGEEIVAAVAAGAVTVNAVKRRTRAGMGLCQGIFCIPFIAATVAQATGTPIDRVGPMTARAPVRPIRLEALADLNGSGTHGSDPTTSEKG